MPRRLPQESERIFHYSGMPSAFVRALISRRTAVAIIVGAVAAGDGEYDVALLRKHVTKESPVVAALAGGDSRKMRHTCLWLGHIASVARATQHSMPALPVSSSSKTQRGEYLIL